MTTNVRLAARITDGLFASERTATFDSADGETSAFVHVSHVTPDAQAVLVHVLEEDTQFALVHIPTQCGSTVVKVPRSDLTQL